MVSLVSRLWRRARSPSQEIGASNTEDRRILILGSAPHTTLVAAYTWDNLPQDLNVADYDVVILNLVPLSDREFACALNVHTLPSWEQFTRHLFSEDSELIIIGTPGVTIGRDADEESSQHRVMADLFGAKYYPDPPWQLPIAPIFEFEPGESIQEINPEFAYYMKHVHHWGFHATQDFQAQFENLGSYAHVAHPQANNLQVAMRAIAQTRFQQAIAFELQFLAVVERSQYVFHGPKEVRELRKSGKVIWLPPPTELSPSQAIDLILRERYGLRYERPSPNWVQAYILPHQIPIEEEVAHYEEEIVRLKRQLVDARQRLQEQLRFRKMLYEQGEDVLEPVVRDALRELTDQVEDPQQRGREDGRLVDPAGRNYMLEIKGRTGTLRLGDVRQLNQWTADAIAEENWSGRGLLIANMHCSDPPDQRGDPFPPNCIQLAQRFDQCLLTTTQLFRALVAHQRGELDLEEFWETIFATRGVCQLPELHTQ